ncbi:MAG: DUF4268 domain-containing protein [Planctomycetes bacterium]|nr:DUF4268 domain-containing protein [Planctomycetota bacterium]
MTSKPTLSRLERVPLRQCWQREDSDFTPWLAGDDNIALLGEAIGMELEVQEQEVGVGPFRADILCRHTIDGSFVVIENQLERTDHAHLGQLLTYAAGLEAVTLVWVVERFTEEHRATLDWLNRITDDGFHFFGVEVELWRIGDSDPAPKFNVVAKPNDWSKTVRETASSSAVVTETGKLRAEFWGAFGEFLKQRGSALRSPPAKDWNWVPWGLGRTGFQLSALVNIRDKYLQAYINLHGPDVEAHYQLLLAQKAVIESELGFELEWRANEKERKLLVEKGWDPVNRSLWGKEHEWLLDKLTRLESAFRPRIRELDARDWTPPEEGA